MSTTFTLAATAAALERRLRAYRPLALPAAWADELVFPFYDGLALPNVSQTVARLMGVELPGGPPLDAAVWGGETLDGQIDRVVVFLTDGLGYLWLRQAMADDPEVAALVGDLTGGRGPVPLTSVAPSTTVTALSTLWTGRVPAVHGMLGLRLHLREIAMLANILSYKPASGSHPDGILSQWGLPAEQFVPVPGLAELLAAAGVPTHSLLPYPLLGTGLSRILHRGIQHRHSHAGYSDLWPRLSDVLRATAGQRCYINVYWPAVDSISHQYGAYNRYVRFEIRQQLSALREVLAAPEARDGRTLVIILADHGQTDTPHELNLTTDAAARPIFDALRASFGGENRLPFLYLREGTKAAVIETLERDYADSLTWVEPAAALAAGLFGLDTPYAETPHRLGDLILIPRRGWKVSDSFMRLDLVSLHGGLSDVEMLVPFLWQRL